MSTLNLDLTYNVHTQKSYYPNSRAATTENFMETISGDAPLAETTPAKSGKTGFTMSGQELMEELTQHQKDLKDRLEHPMKYEDEKKIAIGGAELTDEEWDKMISRVDRLLEDASNLAKTKGKDVIRESQEDMKERFFGKNKYFHGAKDGFVEYNGVMFACNYSTGALELGNCGPKEKANCLRIPLSSGGSLMVNKDSIGGLSKAIDMFDAKDQYLILEAIELYNMVKDKEKELDDMVKGDPSEEAEKIDTNAEIGEQEHEAAESGEVWKKEEWRD